jgi:hypothetical protein
VPVGTGEVVVGHFLVRSRTLRLDALENTSRMGLTQQSR